MARAARRPIALAVSTIAIVAALALAVPALADQTFDDPFDGDGIHSDIGAGSQGVDVGDAFFLRDGDELQIEMFLDAAAPGVPRTFIETHVCLSAEPFTERLPHGLCQFHGEGAASSSYDITLPPAFFLSDTVPFDDPLGSFCAQVHISYAQPELSLTRGGGGGAFAGWQSGRPFYGNLCFPDVPDPLPPGEGTAVVTKVGDLVAGDVVFTVTATNPTTEIAPDVVVIEALPAKLTPWTVPSECTLDAVDFIARCEIGDLAGGASFPLVFSATPPADVCGSFSNFALTTVGSPIVRSADLVIVDVPCPDPPPPPDPLVLLTKEPSTTAVSVPGPITYTMTFENAGPGAATNVTVIDELPAGVVWSLGSGSEVCEIVGKTLTCFAESVADGVFEVLEITGTISATGCGTMDNEGTADFGGGPEPGSITAISEPVEVNGCSGVAPAESTAPVPSGGLPNTSTDAPRPIGLIVVAVAFAIAASVLIVRPRRRS